MLKGKTILLGVTGSIAAYKAADLASRLVKQHGIYVVCVPQNLPHLAHQFLLLV